MQKITKQILNNKTTSQCLNYEISSNIINNNDLSVFRENLAYLITNNFSEGLWNTIQDYFDGVRFDLYDEGIDESFSKEEMASEVLGIFDTCEEVLKDHFKEQSKLFRLFKSVKNYLETYDYLDKDNKFWIESNERILNKTNIKI